MGTYHRTPRVVTADRAAHAAEHLALPESVTIALAETADACKEGLLALSVAAGLQVMQALLEESVAAVAGPKGKHTPDRLAVRHGSDAGAVTLGGRRIPVQRPRLRTADRRAEVAVPAYELFASRDLLGRMALERMLAGLSTRRYGKGLEPVGTTVEEAASGTSKSAVSRRFVALTRTALAEMMARRLDDLDVLVLMIDGIHVAEHLCVVAMVIDAEGRKHPVGLVEGATENGTVVTGLLEDLVARGLDVSQGLLVVIDGSKALAAAVRKVFGRQALMQRCQEHYAEQRIMPSTRRAPWWDKGFVLVKSA
jgi:transposase-like protein